MVSSMTGFGRGKAAQDGREMTVELKSVNHRYLDLAFRMPRHISFTEDTLRTTLNESLSRGHVDVFVNYRNTRTDAKEVRIDTGLLGAYLKSVKEAAAELMMENDMTLSTALRLPDVTDIVEADEDNAAVAALAKAAAEAAVKELVAARRGEGERLADDLTVRLKTVDELREKIELRAPMVVEEYANKLNERIEVMLGSVEVDRQRLATEVALFADKASIDEELVRLKSHTAQARELLDQSEAAGRRLDFVVQEMNREFNTIGSKANDAEIARLVILGKAELEKIREQVQNIE